MQSLARLNGAACIRLVTLFFERVFLDWTRCCRDEKAVEIVLLWCRSVTGEPIRKVGNFLLVRALIVFAFTLSV